MYGWSQRANEGKALLNFMQGCIGICSKGRNTVFGVPAFARILHAEEKRFKRFHARLLPFAAACRLSFLLCREHSSA